MCQSVSARKNISALSGHCNLTLIGLPQFGSELKFEPEPCRTGPKFGSRFGIFVEPNLWSSSRFGEILDLPNLVEPGSNQTFRRKTSIFPKSYCIFYILIYYKISISSNKFLLQNISVYLGLSQ